MADFGFDLLRPWWLLGLIPWLLAAVFMISRQPMKSGWEAVVDAELQPYVIEPGAMKNGANKWLLLFGWLVCLLTLSGPVWEKQDLPVFQGQQAQVVLFDLSASMTIDDIKPSRVARARFKLMDFLDNASGVQIALVAFAERPYVVSPLSDDSKTIAAFVESLDPSIMPAQGGRVDLAIEKGVELLAQAGIAKGQLVLITDSDVQAKDLTAAKNAQAAGHRLSIIGVGTSQGAPLRGVDGRFLQDKYGAVVVPRLNENELMSLAKAGQGVFVKLSSDASDLQALNELRNSLSIDNDEVDGQASGENWVEYGPFAVLVIALLSLLLFRRGVIW